METPPIARGRGRRYRLISSPSVSLCPGQVLNQQDKASVANPPAAAPVSSLESIPSISGGRGRGRGKARNAPQLEPDVILVGSRSPESEGSAVNSPVLLSSLDSIPLVSGGRGRGKPRNRHGPQLPPDSNPDVLPVWSRKLESRDEQESSCKPDHEEVLTDTSPEIDNSSSTTPPEDWQPTLSDFLPKYFTVPNPPKRLRQLKESPVQILKVLDAPGCLMVAFQDYDSLHRFNYLLQLMHGFYISAEGYNLKKPKASLEIGEIVAANVYTLRDTYEMRRVQILEIERDGNGVIVNVLVMDIDNLNVFILRTAFGILEPFYLHPVQACPVRIKNFEQLCPKEIFQPWISNRLDMIMTNLTNDILLSLIGKRVIVSNIELDKMNDNDKPILAVEIDPKKNPQLETHFVDAFCKYFEPVVPQPGIMCEGILGSVNMNGNAWICMKDGLFEKIDEILNAGEFHRLAERINEDPIEHMSNITERISRYYARIFLAEDDKGRIGRVKVGKFYNEKGQFRCHFMDTGKTELLSANQLICEVTGHPKLPALLSLLPPQALRFQLANVQYSDAVTCAKIWEQCKSGICFKVTLNECTYGTKIPYPEVLLYDPLEISSEVVPQPLNLGWQFEYS